MRILMLLPGIRAMSRSGTRDRRDGAGGVGVAAFAQVSNAGARAWRTLAGGSRARQSAAGAGAIEWRKSPSVRQLYDDVLRERYDRVEPRLADLDQLRDDRRGLSRRAAFSQRLALNHRRPRRNGLGREPGLKTMY